MQAEMMDASVRNKKRRKSLFQLLGLILITLAACVGLIAGALHKGSGQDTLALQADAASSDVTRKYLVEIDTCSNSVAGTTSTPYVTFTYTDSTGNEHVTERYKITDEVTSFYKSCLYNSNVSANYSKKSLESGKSAYFVIDTEDGDTFTSADFEIEGADDWQFERFAIYPYDGYEVLWNGTQSGDNSYVCCTKKSSSQTSTIYLGTALRLSGMDAIANVNALEDYNSDTDSKSETVAGFYITENRSRTISFYGKSSSSVKTWDRASNKYAMEYETACSNLPFTETYYKYKVVVHVAGNSDTTDDTGSSNYFYFQLEFENGDRSAYVQANQQLTSDSFKAGQDAVFYIKVNQDYGAVKAIRIIPENATDIGDPYDKMKIDTIDVYNTSAQGVVSTWTINDVGWIGIDYTEDVNSGRTENEIMKRFAVTSVDSALTLQFAITTAVNNWNTAQMNGTLLGRLYYIDSNTGEEVCTDYEDLVAKIKDFNGDTTSNKDSNGYQKGKGLMFDGGKTVRFLWQLKDVKEVTKLELRVYDNSGAYWDIGNICVSLIGSGDQSAKTLSLNGEYLLDDVELFPIASIDFDQTPWSSRRFDCCTDFNAGFFQEVSHVIVFKSSVKDLSSLVGSNTTMYTVSNDESGTDTVNIIAVCDSKDYSAYTLKATVDYKNSLGNVVPSSATMKYVGTTDGQTIFKISNLNVKDFVTLASTGTITLKATGGDSLLVKYVILQHLRNGILQNTYKCSYGGSVNVCKGLSTSSTTIMQDANQRQVIYLELGDETTDTNSLISESYDLAVAMDYKDSLTGDTMKTQYTFLTESGVSDLKPNEVVEFETSFVNIDEIEALEVTATSGLKAEIKRYAIGVYQGDTCVAWYSYDNSDATTATVVQNETKKLSVESSLRNDSTTVNELTFTFNTQTKNQTISNPGVNSAIAMQINYSVKDASGEESIQSMFVPDINDYLVSGSFATGDTAVVKILATGITSANIDSIELVPYDRSQMGKMTSYDTSDPYESDIVWGLSSVSVAFGDGEDHTKTGYSSVLNINLDDDGLIWSNEGYSVDVKSVTIKATVSYTDLDDEVVKEKPVYNQDLTITIPYSEDGRDVTVDLKMTGSDKGWTTEIANISNYGSLTYESAKEKAGTDKTILEDTLTLTMKGNVDADTSKKITFTAVSNKKRSVTLTITMLSYKNTYGSDPLVMNVTSSTGEVCKAMGSTPAEMTLSGLNEETVIIKSSSDDGKITLKVNQTEGNPITYICTDTNDGAASIYLNGNRTATDAVLQVVATCTDSEGNKESVTTNITVKRDTSATTAPTASMTVSYQRANSKVYGVIAGEDRNVKLYVDQESDVAITYTTTDGSILTDQTTYNDQTITETVPSTKKQTEADTDTDTEDSEEEETETETETEETEPETKTTIIPDTARATVASGSLLLPSANTTYTFKFVGNIEVIHQ